MEDNEKVVNAEAEQSAPAVIEPKAAAAPAARPAAPAHSSAARPSRPPYDNNRSDRSDRPQGDRSQRSYGPRPRRKKVCQFCIDRQEFIDYKDTGRMRKFISERAKILPRRVTGTCAQHQRELTIAIKKARQVALLPYVSD